MQPSFEEKYIRADERHWWCVARRDMILRLVRRLGTPRDAEVLDVGCLVGGMIRLLRRHGFTNVRGIDNSADVVELCQRQDLAGVACMDATAMTFDDETFDLLIASDVLEHIEHVGGALREWLRVLKPGGHLIVFVPAFMALWGPHDEANRHFRRYTRPDLGAALRDAGFDLERSGYWNFMLFPPTALIRVTRRVLGGAPPSNPDDTGDLHLLPAPINRAITAALRIENAVIERFGAPIGVSAFAIARRP